MELSLIFPALAVAIAVLYLGYTELRRNPRSVNGLTTWIFAAAPTGAILYLIWSMEELATTLRWVVIGTIVVSLCGLLVYLYRRARRLMANHGEGGVRAS